MFLKGQGYFFVMSIKTISKVVALENLFEFSG